MLVKKRTNKWSSTTTNNDDDSVAVETTARLRSEPAKVGVMKKLVKLSERRKKVLIPSTMATASTNGLNIDTSATSGGYNSNTNKNLASPTQSVTTYTTLKVDNRKKASKNNFYDEADLDSIDRFSSYTDTVDYDKLPNNNTMAELDVDQDCAAILLTKVDNMCGGMFNLIKQEKHYAAAMDMEKFWDRVTGSSVDEDEQWTLNDNTVDGDDNTLADRDDDDGLAYYSHSFATTIESGSLGTNGCAATIKSGSSTDDSNTIGSNTIGSNTVDTAMSIYTGASAPSLGAGVSSLTEARPPRGSMPKTKHDNQKGTSVSAVSSLNSRPRTESTDCSSAQEKAFVSPPSKEKKASETPSKTDNRVRAGSLDFPPSTLSPKPNVANSSRQTYKNDNEQEKTSVPPPSQEEEASETPIKSGNIATIGIATKPIRKTQKNMKGVSPRIFDKMFFHKGRRSTGRVVAKASKHQKEEDAEVMKYLGKKTCTVIDYDYSGAVELAEFDQAEEDRDEIRQDDIPFPVVWTPDPEERDLSHTNEWPHSLKRMTTNDIIFQAQEMLNLDTVRS